MADSAQRLRPVIEALGTASAWLPGYRIKVLDGNHICVHGASAGGSSRLCSRALPGLSLSTFWNQRPDWRRRWWVVGPGTLKELVCWEPVLAAVEPKDLYIADRNFCTHRLSARHREARRLLRDPSPCKHACHVVGKPPRCRGRTESGEVLEQVVTLKLDDEKLMARMIVLRLDTPTRDGETEMSVLTNLSSDVADAAAGAGLYGRRWTVESLFARIERHLQSELATLAYPGAALFVFATVALVASNVFAVVHAAMSAAQKTVDDPKIAAMPLSHFAIVEEIRTAHRGMDIAVSEVCWQRFQVPWAPAPTGESTCSAGPDTSTGTHFESPRADQSSRAPNAPVSATNLTSLLHASLGARDLERAGWSDQQTDSCFGKRGNAFEAFLLQAERSLAIRVDDRFYNIVNG